MCCACLPPRYTVRWIQETYFHNISDLLPLFLSEVAACRIVSGHMQYYHGVLGGLFYVLQQTSEVHASGSWVPIAVVADIFETTIVKYWRVVVCEM